MKTLWKALGKKRLSILLLAALFLFPLLLLFLFSRFPAFAEWFTVVPGEWVRFFLGAITSPFPFSLAEILLYLALIYLFFLIGYGFASLIRRLRKKKALPHLGKCFAVIPILFAVIFNLFAFTLAPSYHRISTAEHMNLSLAEINKEDLFFALSSLSDVISETAPLLAKNERGETLPQDLGETKEKIRLAANRFGEKNPFYSARGFRAKEFLISPLLTYTHISGIYCFFTGEAGFNSNFPHFVVTASLAHETCHARGIAPENECNFLAGVILLESDDPYLRYCGAVSFFDDLLGQCFRIDREKTLAIYNKTDITYYRDQEAYRLFFQPYQDSALSQAADKLNDSYLKAQGQEDGILSYSQTVGLISAYFQKNRS